MTTKTATVIAFSAVNRPDGGETVVERLRRGIAEAELDCGCRETANDVIDRIGAEEDLIIRADGLAEARKMRDAIVMVLALLGELDELMPDEPDRTAFHEIASLFRDVADFASFGAEAARRAPAQAVADVPLLLLEPATRRLCGRRGRRYVPRRLVNG